MPIEFACGSCSKRLRVKDAAAGKRVKCPGCQTVLQVPGVAAGSSSNVGGSSSFMPSLTKSAANTWYVKGEDGQTYGPVSKQELDSWMTEGRLTADSQILREGSDQWQWATDEYPQLAPQQSPSPVDVAGGPAGPAVDPDNPFAFAAGDTSPTARVGGGRSTGSYQRGTRSGGRSGGRREQAPKSGAVTAVAVVNFVVGGLQFLCGGFMIAMGGAVASIFSNIDVPEEAAADAQVLGGTIGGIIVAVGIVMVLFGGGTIVAGIGVLQRAQWGRIFSLVLGGLAGVLAVLNLVSIMLGNIGGILGLLLDGGYCGFVFAILLNRQYAAEFR